MGSRQRIEAYKAKLALQNSAPASSSHHAAPPAQSASSQASHQEDAHQARLKPDRSRTATDTPPDAMRHREHSAPHGAARPRESSPLQRNSSAPLQDGSPVRGGGDAFRGDESQMRHRTGGAGKIEEVLRIEEGEDRVEALERRSAKGFAREEQRLRALTGSLVEARADRNETSDANLRDVRALRLEMAGRLSQDCISREETFSRLGQHVEAKVAQVRAALVTEAQALHRHGHGHAPPTSSSPSPSSAALVQQIEMHDVAMRLSSDRIEARVTHRIDALRAALYRAKEDREEDECRVRAFAEHTMVGLEEMLTEEKVEREGMQEELLDIVRRTLMRLHDLQIRREGGDKLGEKR